MFEQSLKYANHPRYLGNYKVVDGLLRDFVAGVMEAESEQQVIDYANRMAEIFSTLDANYIQPEGWANRNQLGKALEDYWDVDNSMTLLSSLRTAFVLFAQMLMQNVIQYHQDEPRLHKVTDDLIRRFAGVLMGAGAMSK